MQTAEDIQDDIQRLNFGDPEIDKAYEKLRYLFKSKGLIYRELLESKLFGTLKYLLVEMNDENGTIMITDLDSNNTFTFCDKKPKRDTMNKIKTWAARR